MKQSRPVAAGTIALVAIAVACTGAGGADHATTADSTSASSPSRSRSPSTGPESETPQPIPARAPQGIVAITRAGDVVAIDLDTLATRTIASFPPVEAGEPDPSVQAFLTDVAVLPDGKILLSTCCEPAAGWIRVLDSHGNELRKRRPLTGDDPEVDPSGTRLVLASLDWLMIVPASLRRGTLGVIRGAGRYPDEPGWSPDGRSVVFSLSRRIGLVEANAGSLRDAQYVFPSTGRHWGSTAFPRGGPLAVEIDGRRPSLSGGARPSRILRVDFATGERRVIESSDATITDLATDRAGKALLWVDGGSLRWRLRGAEVSLSGDYLKAAFSPG